MSILYEFSIYRVCVCLNILNSYLTSIQHSISFSVYALLTSIQHLKKKKKLPFNVDQTGFQIHGCIGKWD